MIFNLFKTKKTTNSEEEEKDYTFGLTEDFVRDISKDKEEPKWMLEKRLEAFRAYKKTPLPNWGPDLSKLNLNEIVYYIPSDLKEQNSWSEVPKEIAETFEKLGIPKAEKEYLGGVGAQYDSGVVYHSIKESLKKQGVVFENMDTALKLYPDLVKKYFMTDCIKVDEHKFAMLHAACWSGGTFIYVPKDVKVKMPLQSYFRMNKEKGGQFEHTLIIADEGAYVEYIEGCSAPKYSFSALHAGGVEIFVHKNAKVKYSSIENWSKNVFNLNTKKALVFERGEIEWLNGNTGSSTTMLYPSSILLGEYARSESLGIAMAGKGQNQDVGSKVVHIAPNTYSVIKSKSIAKNGGISNYRGFVEVAKGAKNSKIVVNCDTLILDKESKALAIPVNKVSNQDVEISHEAKVGQLSDKEIFYANLHGFDEYGAQRLIIGGFANEVIKKLPLEYAIELNKLIDLEIEGM
ncbi:MAG: Fe-S cluster assembly protein SufB [Candidatus Elulimicrobiales bacterium]|nr:Fe-S cluster assembly protein SufB [Candidatus Elulimicrobiales bacterium]